MSASWLTLQRPSASLAVPALLLVFLLLAGCAAPRSKSGLGNLSPEGAKANFEQAETAYKNGLFQLSYDGFMACENAGYQRAQSLTNAGAAMLALRQSRQALSVLERAVQMDPGSAAAWYNYGLAFYGSGNFDNAINALRRSAEIAPDNPDVWTALGASFMSKRQPGVAVEQFTRALGMLAGNSTILLNRAGAYLDATLYKEALQDYQTVLAGGGAEREMAQMGIGDVYLAQNKCRDAEAAFSKVLGLTPTNGMAFYNRGIAQLQCGNYQKAADDFTRALAFEPGFIEAQIMRGDTYFMLRQPEKGCKDLVEACNQGNCARLEAIRESGQCPRF